MLKTCITGGANMAARKTKYPDLQRWWEERLFRRRQFNGEQFSVGRQEWYISRLRGVYFGDFGKDPYVGVKFSGPGIPFVESQGWRKAKIRDGFGYVHIRDMRAPMMALLLAECTPLPSARVVARQCDMAWEQFANDFVEGLFDMYKAGVGLRGI